MADDLPDRIVLDDPDFLGLVVALLCLARRWERIPNGLRLIRTSTTNPEQH